MQDDLGKSLSDLRFSLRWKTLKWKMIIRNDDDSLSTPRLKTSQINQKTSQTLLYTATRIPSD